MTREAIVLAVPHQIQGPQFYGFVDDPSYSILLGGIISGEQVDFVFEEAAGRNPSTAENLANSILGAGHYLDFDPPRNQRPEFGIAEDVGGGGWIAPGESADSYETCKVEEQEKRERLWLHRILSDPFDKALVIVGLAHSLSIAFRLSVELKITGSYNYIPYSKLCTRQHV